MRLRKEDPPRPLGYMNKFYKCPVHSVELEKLPVLYGLPIPGHQHDNVILGGCCVTDDDPQYGYRCPQGQEVYFLKDGHLIADEDLAE